MAAVAEAVTAADAIRNPSRHSHTHFPCHLAGKGVCVFLRHSRRLQAQRAETGSQADTVGPTAKLTVA